MYNRRVLDGVRIILDDVRMYGHHGVSEGERASGCRLSARVEVALDTKATNTDRVEDTVDYAEVAEVVVSVGEGPSRSTLESLARGMADALLDRFTAINSVTVELAKLQPTGMERVGSAAVRLTLDR